MDYQVMNAFLGSQWLGSAMPNGPLLLSFMGGENRVASRINDFSKKNFRHFGCRPVIQLLKRFPKNIIWKVLEICVT